MARDSLGNSGQGVRAPVLTREIGDVLAEFDRLPPAYRALVRDAPYNIAIDRLTTVPLPALRMTLERLVRESVRETYGPDHPQAK